MTFEPNCLGEKNKWFFFSFALVVLREMPGGLGFFNQDLWQNSWDLLRNPGPQKSEWTVPSVDMRTQGFFFFLINTTPGSRKTNRDFRVLVILRVLVLKYCAPKVEGKGTRCNMSDAGETHVKYRWDTGKIQISYLGRTVNMHTGHIWRCSDLFFSFSLGVRWLHSFLSWLTIQNGGRISRATGKVCVY